MISGGFCHVAAVIVLRINRPAKVPEPQAA
jgi:hypothetical protein